MRSVFEGKQVEQEDLLKSVCQCTRQKKAIRMGMILYSGAPIELIAYTACSNDQSLEIFSSIR